MNKHFTLSILNTSSLALLILAAGCGRNSTHQAENSQAFDSVTLSAYSGYTAVAVIHEVKDYDEWLKVYTDRSDPESRISIYASPDDPNLITVFELTKSHMDAKNVFASDQFKKAMLEEGVISDPVFNYYDVKFREPGKTNKQYRLGVSHEVENYEKWKKVFDEDEPIRTKADLELRAISTNADNQNMVNIMFATDDINKAKGVINSDELRKRMTEAGVRSEPVITVLRVPVINDK